MENQLSNPADFYSPEELKGETEGTKLSDITDFYGVPTDSNYTDSREKDFGDSFAGDLYRNSPAIARKGYDSVADEYEALNTAFDGKYEDEMFFGDNPHEVVAGWDINRSSANSDKVSKFKKYFPNGETRVIKYKGKEILVGRKDVGDPWVKVASNALDTVASGLVSEVTAGQVIGEALGNRIAPGIGGPIGSAFGAVAGDILTKGIEKYKGYGTGQEYVSQEQVPLALASAAFSWYGKGGSIGVGKKLLEKVKPELQNAGNPERVLQATEFATQEGLPALTFGQASTNPIISNMNRQATAIDPTTQGIAINANLAAIKKYNEFKARTSINALDKDTLQGMLDEARYNVGATISAFRAKEIEPEQAAAWFRDAFKNWEELVEGPNGYFDRAYAELAAKSKGVTFDLSAAQDEAKTLIKGTRGAGVTREVPSPIKGPDGEPLGTVDYTPEIKLTEDPRGELEDAMKALTELNPVITEYTTKDGNVYSAYKQLKELRTRFGRLTESPDPGIAGNAKQIYKKLSESFDTADFIHEGGGDEKAWLDQWNKVRKEFKDYQALKDTKVMGKMTNLDIADYTNIVDNLLVPGKSEALKFISNVIPGAQDQFRNMFLTKMLAGERTTTWEDSITKTINQYRRANDKSSLDFLLKPGEETQLLNYAKQRDTLETSILPKLAAMDRDASATAWEAISKGKAEDLEYLLSMSGGRNSKAGTALRAGVLQKMYELSVTNLPKYGDVFVYDNFRDQLNILKNDGKLQKLFSESEVKWLENLDTYVDAVKVNVGMGANLQTAAVASKIGQLPVTATEEALKKGPSAAVEKGVKAFVLPFSMKMAGRFLLNKPAKLDPLPTKKGDKSPRKIPALSLAMKTTATLLGKQDTIQDMPVDNFDTANFLYPQPTADWK